MSSSSDSEDDNLKQVLEAADTSLLKDSLFSTKPVEEEIMPSHPNELVSQRHLCCDDERVGIDFVPSASVQKIMAKKLSLLVKEQIEFITSSDSCKNLKKNHKSRVRLLNEFDCYVKPFEDFEYEDLGPRKKPHIKRRNVDGDCLDEQSKHESVVIDGEFILSLKETANWSDRSKGKVYQYKLGKGIEKNHHLIEPQNEFTKIRNKNRWNESMIRKAKFFTK